jgi:hypothetical protein
MREEISSTQTQSDSHHTSSAADSSMYSPDEHIHSSCNQRTQSRMQSAHAITHAISARNHACNQRTQSHMQSAHAITHAIKFNHMQAYVLTRIRHAITHAIKFNHMQAYVLTRIRHAITMQSNSITCKHMYSLELGIARASRPMRSRASLMHLMREAIRRTQSHSDAIINAIRGHREPDHRSSVESGDGQEMHF